MMRRLLLALPIILLLSCTSSYEDIVFVEITNVRLQNVSKDSVDLVADCILYNPNTVGFDLTEADFDVYVNGRKAAKVLQEREATMPGKEEFTFPIKASISPEELYGEKASGLFDVVLKALANEKIDVKYEGTIIASKGFMNFTVPIVDSLAVPVSIKP